MALSHLMTIMTDGAHHLLMWLTVFLPKRPPLPKKFFPKKLPSPCSSTSLRRAPASQRRHLPPGAPPPSQRRHLPSRLRPRRSARPAMPSSTRLDGEEEGRGVVETGPAGSWRRPSLDVGCGGGEHRTRPDLARGGTGRGWQR